MGGGGRRASAARGGEGGSALAAAGGEAVIEGVAEGLRVLQPGGTVSPIPRPGLRAALIPHV